MQNTRFNQLIDGSLAQLNIWFSNPWRRFSAIALSFALGFFVGAAASLIAGQIASWDVVAAALLVVLVELISRLAYSGKQSLNSFILNLLNAFKIGAIYSLFVEAFKLGS